MNNILHFPLSGRFSVQETLKTFAEDDPVNNVLILSEMGANEEGLIKIAWSNMTGEEALLLLEEARQAILCGAFINYKIEAE